MNTEQIKLAAAAFNNLGVGALLTGIVSPMVTGLQTNVPGWYVFGVLCLVAAQVILLELE
jgi:hypothetical protein